MASRRDLLLQQLGITQWVLRRPAVLQGEIAIHLPEDTRLLIVAQQLPEHGDPLLCDVPTQFGPNPPSGLCLDAGSGRDVAGRYAVQQLAIGHQ